MSGGMEKQVAERPASAYSEEANVAYLKTCFGKIIKKKDDVLICTMPGESPRGHSRMKKALEELDAVVWVWEKDWRWRNLIWLAFSKHVSCIVGSARIVLGLAKIARATKTPLNVQDAVIVGALPGCEVYQSICNELDCRVWQCYTPFGGEMLMGFSEGDSERILIRPHGYEVNLDGEKENPNREIIITAQGQQLRTGDLGELEVCGGDGTSMRYISHLRRDIRDPSSPQHLDEILLPWSSILDYQITQTENGADLELVTFPGEKLPKLPSFARMVVRAWNPMEDVPFCVRQNAEFEN